MDKQPDIEIYVNGTDLKKVAEWLEEKFGTIPTEIPSVNSGMAHFRVKNGRQELAVSVTEGFKFPPRESTYTSVYFVSSEVPWRNDVDCAREAVFFFDTDIVCDATALGYSAPNQWLSVTGHGEEVFLTSEDA